MDDPNQLYNSVDRDLYRADGDNEDMVYDPTGGSESSVLSGSSPSDFPSSVQSDGGAITISPDQISSGTQTSTVMQAVGSLANGKNLFDNTQTGFVLGVDEGIAKFFIGTSSSYMNWDGSALTISGTITASTFQTATSGQRIRIVSAIATGPSQAANSLILINSNGDQILQFGSDVSNSTLSITPIDNNVTGLLVANDASLVQTNPLSVFTIANASSSAVNIAATNNGTGVVASFSKALSVSTHFKKYISLDGTIFWKSDGTSPNGNLSGTAGDFCVNADSSQVYYCTGTTNWSAPGALALSRIPFSTAFETAARFTRTVGGPGSAVTFGASGMELGADISGGAPGFAKATWTINGLSTLGSIYSANHSFRTRWDMNGIDPNAATRYSSFFGFGQPTVAATGHTFTDKHIGFKAIYNGSSISLYATCADGVTETSTLLTVVNGLDDQVDVYFDIISASLVNFYYSKNDSGYVSAVPIQTNIPTSNEQVCQFSFATENVDRGGRLTFFAASYI